jgi:excisionase family DNA binding protein
MGTADADGDLDLLRLLTVNEAAERLGWTKTKVQHAYKRGHLPVVRVGRRVYFAERDLVNLTRLAVQSLPKLATRRQPPKRLRFTPRRPRGRT